MWCLENKKFVISRDMIFDAKRYTYWDISTKNNEFSIAVDNDEQVEHVALICFGPFRDLEISLRDRICYISPSQGELSI